MMLSSSVDPRLDMAADNAGPRVVLSTIGKFWTFDLARQLHRRNALTAIFSGYPSFKLRNESLPPETIKTFSWLHAPYMKFAPKYDPLRIFWEWQDKIWFDRYVANHLPPCDVFCGLSGSGLLTGMRAKKSGARYVCDRGSAHIRFQNNILKEEHDRQGIRFAGVDPRVIDREEAEYELADSITVPSSFAVRTFEKLGVPRAKLQLAPYGVDLSKFYPCAKPEDKEFQILFVGTVSVRKGIGYLVKAFDLLTHAGKHLTLVGPVEGNYQATIDKLKIRSDISILGPKPQAELKEIMSQSHVMVLPSIEDGFGLVMAQAMACGCPVIASENTGGSDLFKDGVEGYTIPVRSSDSLAARLQYLADNPDERQQMGALAIQRVKSLGGWDSYGDIIYQRYQSMVLGVSGLRILYIGPKSGTSLHRANAFRRLGHDVFQIDTRLFCPSNGVVDRWIWRTGGLFLENMVRRGTLSAIENREFDLVFVNCGELVSGALVREMKRRFGIVVNYNIDDPYGGRDMKRWRQYLEAVPFYDLTVVLRECNVEEAYRAGATRVLHVTMSADEVAHAPRALSEGEKTEFASDVLFLGTWMPERSPFLAKLIELGVPVSIWGHRWPKAPEWSVLAPHWRGLALLDGDGYAKAVQCAKVCLGLLSKGNRDQSTTRSFEIPLLGGVLCAERTPEHLSLYREDVEAVFWDSPEECARKCLRLLSDAKWRQQIARDSRLRCLANGSTNEPIMERIIATARHLSRLDPP